MTSTTTRTTPLDQELDRNIAEALASRAVIVRRLKPLPIEAVVRGYLIGSGWKDYQRGGRGRRMVMRLPSRLMVPSLRRWRRLMR